MTGQRANTTAPVGLLTPQLTPAPAVHSGRRRWNVASRDKIDQVIVNVMLREVGESSPQATATATAVPASATAVLATATAVPS